MQIPGIIRYAKEKAEFLQKTYYDKMAASLGDGTNSRKKGIFKIEVYELIDSLPEYHILRFEIDKLLSFFYSGVQDAVLVQHYIYKIFTIDIIDSLFELFEVVASISDVFSKSRSVFHDIHGATPKLFMQMFSILTYPGRHGNNNMDRVEVFEKRFRRACSNLALCFEDVVETKITSDKDLGIKYVDLIELLKPENKHLHAIPEKAK
jgi:hypothetical protein